MLNLLECMQRELDINDESEVISDIITTATANNTA